MCEPGPVFVGCEYTAKIPHVQICFKSYRTCGEDARVYRIPVFAFLDFFLVSTTPSEATLTLPAIGRAEEVEEVVVVDSLVRELYVGSEVENGAPEELNVRTSVFN